MAIPTEESIQLPLLRVIADAGGELPLQEAVKRVGKFFPELSEEDRQQKLPSGKSFSFINRVQWTRQRLVEIGYLYHKPRGLWRITPQGKMRLNEGWSLWLPKYSRDKSKRNNKASSINQTEKGVESASVIPITRPHEHLQELIRQIGDILGYFPECEFRESPYIYDVVWKTFPQAQRPGFVFEVQDKGNLIEALAKLQHAKDTWGSKLFLTITGDHDRKRIEKLVAPLLSGTFHRLARYLVLLTPDQIENLYTPLNHQRDLVQKLLQE